MPFAVFERTKSKSMSNSFFLAETNLKPVKGKSYAYTIIFSFHKIKILKWWTVLWQKGICYLNQWLGLHNTQHTFFDVFQLFDKASLRTKFIRIIIIIIVSTLYKKIEKETVYIANRRISQNQNNGTSTIFILLLYLCEILFPFLFS